MTKEIPINHKGEVLYALCDDEDYPLLSRHCWYIRSATSGVIYATTTLMANIGQRKLVYMHNMILPGDGVDHVSRNKLDNQKDNLRKATYQQNGWNKGKNKSTRGKPPSSQYKGVVRCVGAKGNVYWRVIFKLSKKGEKPERIARLGPFATEIEAAKAYNEEVVKHRGEWAWLNPLPV